MKYLYGRTYNALEDIEYVNAAHVFSDILAMSQNHEHGKHSMTNKAAESSKSANARIGDKRNGILKHFSPEVCLHVSRLTIVVCCQCSPRGNKSFLVISSVQLFLPPCTLRSPAEISTRHT